MNNILKINTDLSDSFNESVIAILRRHTSWGISDDENAYNQQVDTYHSDSGMILLSYSEEFTKKQAMNNYRLNVIGDLIFKACLKAQNKFNIINPKLGRLLWNYYNKSSTGLDHRDINPSFEGNFCSIVYYLNTCDGGTIIENHKVDSVAGNAVMFNSKTQHRGIGPSKDKFRFALNMCFKYDKLIEIDSNNKKENLYDIPYFHNV